MIRSLLALWLVATSLASADPPHKKVLLIGIDGCRGDALAAANIPNLQGLMDRGCYTLNALTDEHAISGAGWSNLLTGVWAEKHGAVDNEFKATHYDAFPHVFNRLASTHPNVRCGHFCDWLPLDEKILGQGKIATRFACDYKDGGDAKTLEAARSALAAVGSDDLDFVFVYFADVDVAGHTFGFHSAVPEYRKAIEQVDARIGVLMSAIASRSNVAGEDWLILVTSDHGGSLDKMHGRNIESHRRIPFIASGRATKRGRLEEIVNQVDVVPTVLAHLEIPIDPAWRLDGHVVALRSSSTLLDSNLIENGDAESNGGNDTTTPDCKISAFADEGGMTTIRYGAPRGFPSLQTPGPTDRGRNFFCGGDAASSSIEQRIDVSSLRNAIDAGAIDFTLSAWLGGFGTQRDLIELHAEFLSRDSSVLGTAILPPVTLEDRATAFKVPLADVLRTLDAKDATANATKAGFEARLTGLVQRKREGIVPRGTRIIRIELVAEASEGACDGYADDLSFVLTKKEPTDESAAIQSVLQRILVADNAGDIEGILACYTDDAVLLPPASKPLVGKELVRERYKVIFGASTLEVRAEVDEIGFDGDLAIVRGTTLGKATLKDAKDKQPGEATREVKDSFVMILRRERGEWRVARLMWHPQSTG